MEGSFSQVVASPQRRHQAQGWLEAQLTESGHRLTGKAEQRRIRPWSTQLAVPTDRGPVWFKANCEALAFEPEVQRVLSLLVADEVDAPLALDRDRGWMLTVGRGRTLRDEHEPTLDDWRAVVRLAATLQRRVAHSGPTLVAAGLPDCAPETVESRHESLVQRLLPAAMVTHAVNRSFTWLGAIEGVDADELQEWGDAPAYYLRLAHEPFPPVVADQVPSTSS